MTSMKVAQVTGPGHPLEVVERPIPEPAAGRVRIRVEACGVCHSDSFVKEGLYPGLEYPRVPGHEVVGTIDAIGSAVSGWSVRERVGVGWAGGHCGRCDPCRRGDFVNCVQLEIPGISYDGGYAEFMIAPAAALVHVPAGLSGPDAAPILCAGVTTFNALRNAGARAGDVVAVQGVGGLGHLALQFASRMGFRTVAISSGADKEPLAGRLGAVAYVDTAASDPAAELAGMGGARVILATAPDSKAISALVDGLAVGGTLLVVAAAHGALEVEPLKLILGRRRVQGWPSGSAIDSEDALRFSAAAGIRPMVETFPLERAAEAYERMISGRVRFRSVITMAAAA